MNVIFHASAGTGKTYQVTNLYVSLLLGLPYDAKDAGGKAVRLYEPEGGKAVDPRRILLVTFTENAAAELRTRVTQLVLKARYEATDDATIQRTVEVLRALPSAPISTIHSFCAGFLREHALEAGLSPGFAVLDDADSRILLDDVARTELLARLNRAEPTHDADFEAFCISEQRVLGGGEHVVAVSDAAVALLRQADSKGIDLRNAENLLPKPGHSVTRDDFVKVLEGLKTIRAARGGKLTDTAAAVFQRLEKALKEFPTFGKNPHPSPLPQAGEGEGKRTRRPLPLPQGDGHTQFPPSPPSGGEGRGEGALDAFLTSLTADGKLNFSGKDMKELSDRLKELVETAQNESRYGRQYPEIRAFARYAAAVAEAYERRKGQLNAVDFDGLLIRARDMLRNLPAQERGKGFDYLIVDEVQDTSRVQCEIIESLWDPASNHLVICGDTKQSIYAWRNADPSVMPDLEKEIGGTKKFRRVPLKASFRSKDSILDVVNPLFEQVYAEAYTVDDRLTATADKDAFVRKKGERKCVELMVAPWEGAGQRSEVSGQKSDGPPESAIRNPQSEIPVIEERVRSEMTAVAQRIRLLVDGSKDWTPGFRYDEDAGKFAKVTPHPSPLPEALRARGEGEDKRTKHPLPLPLGEGRGEGTPDNFFRYSDILILLRRRTNQQVLEHVLRQYDIPYRIGGPGRGLFGQPEVKDTLLFLKVLTHPFDTISLAGFLRSPWIGLSDEAIIQLGWSGGRFVEESFRERVFSADKDELVRLLDGGQEDPSPQPSPEGRGSGGEAERQAGRVLRARELVSEFAAQTDCRLASDLVRELIARTAYDAVIAGTFRGGQHLANLRKLIDWLRQTERGGTVLLADVVEKLQENADSPPDIPEAALLDPEENAVTIMTVHGAKGLTSRVVFVPELSAQPSGDTSWALLDTPETKRSGDRFYEVVDALSRARLSTAVLHVKTEDIGRKETTTPGYKKAVERAKEIRNAESKNVFYVAMTRARDLVVLSGPTGGKKATGWREQIDTLLAGLDDAGKLVRTVGFEEIAAAEVGRPVPWPPDSSGHAPARKGLRALPMAEVERGGSPTPPDPALFEAVSVMYPRPLAVPVILRYPATTLSAFHADPDEYLKTKLAGAEPPWMKAKRLPEEGERAGEDAPAPADTDEAGSYAAFGTAGHSVLEQLALDGWKGDVKALAQSAAAANGLAAEAAGDLATRLGQAVAELADRTKGSKEVRAEWPFALALEKDGTKLIVDGTMDLIFQGSDEKWQIVDYKFTDDPPSKLLKKYSLQLNLYREALVRAGFNAGDISSTLIAISREGVRAVEVPPDPTCSDTALHTAVALHRASG